MRAGPLCGAMGGAAPVLLPPACCHLRARLQEAAQQLLASLGDPAALLIASTSGDKLAFVAAASPAAVKAGVQSGQVVGAVAKLCGGGGGGKPALAQAGGKDASRLGEALALARSMLQEKL